MIRELERLLAAHLGEERAIVDLHRRPYEYRTSFPLDEISVELEGGERLRVLVKDLGRTGLEWAKPGFLYDPLREIEAYEAIAEHGVGPIYYGSVVDRAQHRFWLVLEEIAGIALWQIGERSTWQEAARWLARFHQRLGDLRPSRALVYDRELYGLWIARAREFTGSPEVDRIAESYGEVVGRLTELPTGFIHGEFYASNVLVSRGDEDVGIRAVDWEMAAVGPGLLDLAALASGWRDEEVSSLKTAYRTELADPPPEDEFDVAFDCCRLHLAVQWLGWGREWTPPKEHAQDWLGEAVQMAGKLGL